MEELDVGKKDLKVNKKDVLVSDFGKDLFKPKFDENINTWENVCDRLGFSKEDISFNHPIDTKTWCNVAMKLEITDVSFPKNEYSVGQLSKDADTIPEFYDIDKELFPNGFFNDSVGDYLYHKFYWNGQGKSIAYDNIMNLWIHKIGVEKFYDIKKDVLGNYYIVAGDETGIEYFEKIAGIKVTINGHPTKIQEQANFYLIEILDEKKDNVYDGYKMTLKEAIEDMFTRYNIRKISPDGFTLGT